MLINFFMEEKMKKEAFALLCARFAKIVSMIIYIIAIFAFQNNPSAVTFWLLVGIAMSLISIEFRLLAMFPSQNNKEDPKKKEG